MGNGFRLNFGVTNGRGLKEDFGMTIGLHVSRSLQWLIYLESSVAVHSRMLASLELLMNGRLVLSRNSSIYCTLPDYVLKVQNFVH